MIDVEWLMPYDSYDMIHSTETSCENQVQKFSIPCSVVQSTMDAHMPILWQTMPTSLPTMSGSPNSRDSLTDSIFLDWVRTVFVSRVPHIVERDMNYESQWHENGPMNLIHLLWTNQ